MPTTTSTATITRDDLIRRSLRRIGIHYPNVTQMNQAVGLLNDIMKELDEEGRWLHAINPVASALTSVASQRAYGVSDGLAATIHKLEWFEMVQGTSLRPLRVIYEYEAISNIQREGTGVPYYVYLDPAPVLANRKVYLYPTPAAVYTFNYNFRRRLYDFLLANDNPDIPQDWNQKLCKRLSYELAPEYGISTTKRLALKQEMDEAMEKGKGITSQQVTPRPQRSQYF